MIPDTVWYERAAGWCKAEDSSTELASEQAGSILATLLSESADSSLARSPTVTEGRYKSCQSAPYR